MQAQIASLFQLAVEPVQFRPQAGHLSGMLMRSTLCCCGVCLSSLQSSLCCRLSLHRMGHTCL